MKRCGISSAELAKRADVKTSFIYDILSGKSANPSTVKLARVAESLNINLSALVSSPDTESAPRRMLGNDYVTVPRITIDMQDNGNTVSSVEHEAEYYYFRASWIREHLKADPIALRMLYISGDSMEPTLCHGDIVLVDTSNKTPSPPGIFVIFDGLGLSGKRLEYVSGNKRIRAISDNPQYSTYEYSIDDAAIMGRVVWFAREM